MVEKLPFAKGYTLDVNSTYTLIFDMKHLCSKVSLTSSIISLSSTIGNSYLSLTLECVLKKTFVNKAKTLSTDFIESLLHLKNEQKQR